MVSSSFFVILINGSWESFQPLVTFQKGSIHVRSLSWLLIQSLFSKYRAGNHGIMMLRIKNRRLWINRFALYPFGRSIVQIAYRLLPCAEHDRIFGYGCFIFQSIRLDFWETKIAQLTETKIGTKTILALIIHVLGCILTIKQYSPITRHVRYVRKN